MSSIETLRRYTTLPAAIHLLSSKSLTLLNPASWDDRNDAFYIARYKELKKAQSVLALCFALQGETYHHWKIFAGTDGVCFEFHKDRLLEAITKDPTITVGEVEYEKIADVRANAIERERLPFLKRDPYRDEREYRLLHVDERNAKEFHSVTLPMNCIAHLTLSPWMASPLATSVKTLLKSIEGCKTVRVHQSTLLENDAWKKAAKPELNVEGD